MSQEVEFVSEPHTDFIFQIEGDLRILIVAVLLAIGLAALAIRWLWRRRRVRT